jgi:hypothetical protein
MSILTTTNAADISEVAADFHRMVELREQMAALRAELDQVEESVKTAIGGADAASLEGKIVATYKEGTRVTIPLAKARGLLAERTIAKISTVTTYRTLKVVK